MYLWELVSCRLRGDGWEVWHTTEPATASDGPTYRVHAVRRGVDYTVTGPTLTEAYATAARRARRASAMAAAG
jgi:hypothetical protein